MAEFETETVVKYRGVPLPADLARSAQKNYPDSGEKNRLDGFKEGVDAALGQPDRQPDRWPDRWPVGHKFLWPDDVPDYVTAIRVEGASRPAWRVGDGWLYATDRAEAQGYVDDGITPWALDQFDYPCYVYEVSST